MVWHFVDGAFVEEAKISVTDLGFLRGYGVFDYARVYEGSAFCLEEHIDRLFYSAEKLLLKVPMSKNELYDKTLELIEKNAKVDGGVRFIVTGGESGEYLLSLGKERLLILFQPHVSGPGSIRAMTTKTLRVYPSIKVLNYLPATVAMKEAHAKGFNEILYVGPEGEILEASTANVFFVKGNTVITPESGKIIKGVTRRIFLELAKKNYIIDERKVFFDEVCFFEEAFLTSSTKEGVPLLQIDDVKIKEGHVAKELREAFYGYRLSRREFFSTSFEGKE